MKHKINLRLLEKQTAITRLQAYYLQKLLAIYRKQNINTSPIGLRVSKILAKPRCKSLREIHNELFLTKKKKSEVKKPKDKPSLIKTFKKLFSKGKKWLE